ncbi:MAG: Ig-like domain-containing protein [Tannerella sp.]|jgi:hypothetical protein|nr:Ig-like domain-containing protein [Tannerella sp.]
MNEMKTSKYFSILCTVLLTSLISGCAEYAKYPEYVTTSQIFVNKSLLNMYVGDEVQVSASPADVALKWTSNNEQVVTVTQTGLIKAVGEGTATVSIEYEGYETKKIDIRSFIFIPLDSIYVPETEILTATNFFTQLQAVIVPADATDVVMSWRSEDPKIATVDNDGMMMGVSGGKVNIILSSGDYEKVISVTVFPSDKLDKTGWTVEVSDESAGDGGGKDVIIDGRWDLNNWWHSQYSPNVELPHWAVIDMKKRHIVTRIATLRRKENNPKTLEYYVGDSPDADSPSWIKVAQGSYASSGEPHDLTLNVTRFVAGQYLKLFLKDSFVPPYTGICEIDVYGVEE